MGEQTTKPTGYVGFVNGDQPWLAPPSTEIPFVAVEWDGDEPFLRASPDVVITPWRESDVDAIVGLLGHPDVGKYSFDRPFPYTADAARKLIANDLATPETLKTLRDNGSLHSNPFMAIRYRGALAGDIRVWKRVDGRGVHGLAYDVHPDYQRKGVARAAVSAVLGWAARAMEADKIEAYAETVNTASAAFLTRLGFTSHGTVDAPWPSVSGGGRREMAVWQRELPTPAPWVAKAAPAPPPPTMVLDEGEGYLDLGGGFRITPYRDTAEEVEQMMELSNHPEVAPWLYTRPTPFLASDARAKIARSIPGQQVALAELRGKELASTLPFTVIRNETGRYVGDIALYPVVYCPDRLELSYTLHPDVHGRGLGTRAALAVLGFAGARMSTTSIQAYTKNGNAASGGMLGKLGFVIGEVRPFKWVESKGGGWHTTTIWERELSPPVPDWQAKTIAPPPAPVVQWDGDEPYLALANGFRVTPYRDTEREIAELIELSNLDEIAKWSYTRPAPFTPADARKRLDDNADQAAAVAALKAGSAPQVNPFTVIRDADGRYIGDLAPSTTPGPEGWYFGYKVHPDYHRRGIGSAAMLAVLGYGVHALGVRRAHAYTQTENIPSSRMLEKLGWTLAQVRMWKWPEHCGGGYREGSTWQCEFGV